MIRLTHWEIFWLALAPFVIRTVQYELHRRAKRTDRCWHPDRTTVDIVDGPKVR